MVDLLDEDSLWTIGWFLLIIVVIGVVIGNFLSYLLSKFSSLILRYSWGVLRWITLFAWRHKVTIIIVALGYVCLAFYLSHQSQQRDTPIQLKPPSADASRPPSRPAPAPPKSPRKR